MEGKSYDVTNVPEKFKVTQQPPLMVKGCYLGTHGL
jgi:hypothetical protein